MKEVGFQGAIDALVIGKKVTRKEWNNKKTYYLIKDGLLHIRRAGDKEDRPCVISDVDLIADDWIIL